MRHADLSPIGITPLAPTAPTRPTQGLGSGGNFGALFGQLQGEVADFISNGGGNSATSIGNGGAVASLSPQAQALRVQDPVLAGADGVVSTLAAENGAPAPSQQAFLNQIAPWAREAAEQLGVAPEIVSAHAALESGWGQRPLRGAGGATSNNLFGIKAGAGWQGEVAENVTTEYVNGAAVHTSARFRSYPDASSAFRDYARLLLDNPRYRGAVGAGNDARAFAEGLARGGYATDPNYADKLTRLATRLQRTNG